GPGVAAWHFTSDREGWHYRHATDTGWPIRGELAVQLTQDDPAIISPRFAVRAEAAPVLVIEAALENVAAPHAQVFWATVEQPGFDERRSMRFEANPDGRFRAYRVRLADSPEYRGAITQLRFDPARIAGRLWAIAAAPALLAIALHATLRWSGAILVGRQLAITVLVQLLEQSGSSGDLIGGKRPVAVGIKRRHDRRHRPTPTLRAAL